MWETEEKEQESKQQNELSFSRAAFQKKKNYMKLSILRYDKLEQQESELKTK